MDGWKLEDLLYLLVFFGTISGGTTVDGNQKSGEQQAPVWGWFWWTKSQVVFFPRISDPSTDRVVLSRYYRLFTKFWYKIPGGFLPPDFWTISSMLVLGNSLSQWTLKKKVWTLFSLLNMESPKVQKVSHWPSKEGIFHTSWEEKKQSSPMRRWQGTRYPQAAASDLSTCRGNSCCLALITVLLFFQPQRGC